MTDIIRASSDIALGPWSGVKSGRNVIIRPDEARPISGLVGRWLYDVESDVHGTFAYDSSGRGSNGTLVGGPLKSKGPDGNALSFNGTSQYVSMGNVLNMGTSNWSTSFWMKTSATGSYGLVGRSAATGMTGRWWITTFGSGGKVSIGFSYTTSGIFASSSASVTDNRWHHIVGVWNRTGNETIYVDGVASGSLDISAGSGFNMNASPDFTIGQYYNADGVTPNAFFPGSIDDVRIYNRALTPAEVLQIYNKRKFDCVSTHLLKAPNLFSTVDEVSPDTTDYAQASATGALELKLGTPTDTPGSAQIVSYEIGGGGDMTISLVQIGTPDIEIAAWTHSPVNTSPTQYDQTLTTLQKALITDYTALKLKFNKTA